MQAETMLNLSFLDGRQPGAAVSVPELHKAALSFLYIGKCHQTAALLSATMQQGQTVSGLFEAIQQIRSGALDLAEAEVIFLDLPYNEESLLAFHAVLTDAGHAHRLPLIYNQKQLLSPALALRNSHIIDDVIDLANCPHDLTAKISFLRKTKAYQFQIEHQGSKLPEVDLEPASSFWKRVIDILFSVVALILLIPVFLLIAAAIQIESKGPIFYNARRAGRGFKVFKFYKFRTMEVNADKKIEVLSHLNQYDAEAQGPKFFKISNDPRITRVGRFLRNTSLDELPQLVNVLKGDMSLVGNRPLPLYEASTLTTNEFVERFMAPAGITGLWQIKKRGRSDMSVEERINLDISYAQKSNLLYDLWIMANTPGALIQKSDV